MRSNKRARSAQKDQKANNTAKAKKEQTMPKNTKTNKVGKANANAKKADKATATPKYMTYPQAKALTNALFNSKPTTRVMSEKLDKLFADSKGQRRPMSAEKKAKWLEEHGDEPATYGQCKAYAFGLLNAKRSHAEISKMIEALDKKNGYVRQPKAENAVEKLNEQAKQEEPKQINLLEGLVEENTANA